VSAELLKKAPMRQKLIAFFSNGGYATWVQSALIIASVAVALYAVKETDANAAVSNAVGLAQKYFTDKPTLASASLRLRIAQYEQVQEAKKQIGNNYNQAKDPDYDRLFEAARPLVQKTFSEKTNLQDDYHVVNDFFSGVMLCVANDVCDKATSVKLLAWEMIGFYNAACPFMEENGKVYSFDEDSPRYIAFLVKTAAFGPDKSQYFCRTELASYLAKTKTAAPPVH
jgi:heme exporter protein D